MNKPDGGLKFFGFNRVNRLAEHAGQFLGAALG